MCGLLNTQYYNTSGHGLNIQAREAGRMFQMAAGADMHLPMNEDCCLPCEMPSCDEWLPGVPKTNARCLP